MIIREGKKFLPHKSCEERPLVHVFIIQESMRLDALQAAVEAISSSITSMHPDIYVCILTYSHRIGMYRYDDGGR